MGSRFIALPFVAALLTVSTGTLGATPTNEAARQYYVDIQLFSMNTREGLDSYRGYGGGGVGGPNATFRLFAKDERKFSLEVETRMRPKESEVALRAPQESQNNVEVRLQPPRVRPQESVPVNVPVRVVNEFVARVVVKPDESDTKTKPMNREIVLSDLEPQSIEVARSDDGRVYRVQLIPKVKELTKPRRFDADALRLDHLGFPGSPVILNDQTYVGRMSMSSGQLASLDLSGLALVEFSLIPFRGAEPAGTLKDGVVEIVHKNGTALRISDVKNGIHPDQLTGGPYQVFVRWSEPSMTDAEYRQYLEEAIVRVKKEIESGARQAGKDWLERLERAQSSSDPMMMSCSVRAIPSADRIESN